MATNNSINTGKPIEVVHGGTQKASFTAYAPITGGTTSTGALQSADTNIATVGTVLTSTGASSLPTWQTVSPGASGSLVLLSTQTVTNVSEVDFVSVMTGTYNDYVLLVNNYLPSSSGTDLLLQFSYDNGGSYLTSSSYQVKAVGVASTSATWSNSSGTSNGLLIMSSVLTGSAPSNAWTNLYNFTTGVSGLTDPASSGNVVSYSNLTSSTYGIQLTSSTGPSFLTSVRGAITAIRLISSSGNIAQGTFSLYGLTQ